MEESRKVVSGKHGGKNLFVCRTNASTHLPGMSGRYLWEYCLQNLTGFVLGSGTLRGLSFFNPLSSNVHKVLTILRKFECAYIST